MKVLLKVMFVCGLISLADHAVLAQTQPPACPPVGGTFGLLQVSPRTGCPFSAVIEITRSQTLADGTHVQVKNKTLVYRDSLGRVRFDNYAPAQEAPGFVQIFDPVEGVQYFIRPQFATASRSKWTGPPPSLRVGSTPPPALKPIVERLESQQMEGLLATGTRITRTISADAEGNDRALTIVSEIWSSSDMGITLLEKNSDPRSGDVEKRMTDLERTEPDVALFHVPPDYTITDQ
jgi:hypothetical protein